MKSQPNRKQARYTESISKKLIRFNPDSRRAKAAMATFAKIKSKKRIHRKCLRSETAVAKALQRQQMMKANKASRDSQSCLMPNANACNFCQTPNRTWIKFFDVYNFSTNRLKVLFRELFPHLSNFNNIQQTLSIGAIMGFYSLRKSHVTLILKRSK